MTMVKVNRPLNKSLNGFVNEFFNEFPTAMGKTMREEILHYPPVNISETPDTYFVELSAPGFEKADFKVSLENNMLTISTEKSEEKPAENNNSLRKEFSLRSFKRSFTIDEKIEADKISAKYENGIMKLELPKRDIAKAVTRDINIL